MALLTPPGTSEYTMHVDEKDGREILVCTVGKTVLHYNIDCLKDLHEMLKNHGDWMELGSADEQKPAKDGTVEAWGRSEQNPAGGWYGLKKGLRGRFGMICFFIYKYFAPPELRGSLGSWFYKHLVPPGPKTSTTRRQTHSLRGL